MVKEYQSATQEIFLKLKKYFYNSRVKINIEKTQYMCTTLFKDYHVLLYECTNKIVQEDSNNAIIVKTSLFQGFPFE